MRAFVSTTRLGDDLMPTIAMVLPAETAFGNEPVQTRWKTHDTRHRLSSHFHVENSPVEISPSMRRTSYRHGCDGQVHLIQSIYTSFRRALRATVPSNPVGLAPVE